MIEVEAKIGISDPKLFRSKIKKLARYVKKEKKIDEYYTLESLKSYPKKTLRVRELNGHYEVNIKHKISYVKGVHAKREVELRSYTKDLPNFVKIIKDLGFKKWLKKEKEVEIYNIKKNFNIELNKVKRLGWFLEVEYLSELKDVKKARREVLRVIRKLGVEEKDVIKTGYTKMLWDLKK